jgi:hypothetical protein
MREASAGLVVGAITPHSGEPGKPVAAAQRGAARVGNGMNGAGDGAAGKD